MQLCNYHTHTVFSDGSDPPSAYVEEAISQGFSAIGFSEHAPLPSGRYYTMDENKMNEYARTIRALGEEKRGLIDVFLSLEIDYIPGFSHNFDHFRNHYGLDYTIGSVHLVSKPGGKQWWFIDGADSKLYDQGLSEVFGGDIRMGVTAYYEQLIQMVRNEKPDIIGHLDKIKMNNKGRYFSEKEHWYKKLMEMVIESLHSSGVIVEVNTRGIYKQRGNQLFPGVEILEMLYKRNIPITLSSDAHKPGEISGAFSEALIILKEIGFKKLFIFEKNYWKEINV